MPENGPGRIAGGNEFADAWNKNSEALRSRTPQPSDGLGILSAFTVHGTHHLPEAPLPPYAQPAAATVAGTDVKLGALVSVAADTLQVLLVDGTTVTVYKPYELRQSTNDGLGLTYAYSSGQERDASQGGLFLESQLILPRYTIGGLLWVLQPDYAYATQPAKGNVYLDINVGGRAWARKYV